MTEPTTEGIATPDAAPKRDENMISALKRERAGMVSLGKDDRVAQIDEQLVHYGHTETATRLAAETTEVTDPPKAAKAPQTGKSTR